MKRIRNVGLAVLAALALAAVAGAASASASGFEADEYPVATIEGNVTGEQMLEMGYLRTGCYGQTLKAGSFENPVETITGTPTDATCSIWGSWPLKMNGCKLIFHPGSEQAAGTFEGTFEIGPSGCGPITLTVPTKCKLEIGAQTGLDATYRNIGSGSSATVDVDFEATDVTYTQTDLGVGCPTGTYNDGGWTGDWNLEAADESGQVGLRAADKLPTLIGIQGEESEVEAEQPIFEASKYPVALSGAQDPGQPHAFGFKGGTASCASATFGSEASGATTELSVQAAYSGACTAMGFAGAVVSTNGCGYVFHVLNVGPPYAGEADIVCPEGKAIEIKAKLFGVSKCTVTIPAQKGLSGIGFNNYEWGMVLKAEISLSGIDYHQQEGTGIGRCSSGDFGDGTYAGSIPFQGLS